MLPDPRIDAVFKAIFTKDTPAAPRKNEKSLGTQALFVFLLTVNETLETTLSRERQRLPLNKTLVRTRT
jgi:hypothetical protein